MFYLFSMQTYWRATHPDIRASSTIPRPLPQESSPTADQAHMGPTPPGKLFMFQTFHITNATLLQSYNIFHFCYIWY